MEQTTVNWKKSLPDWAIRAIKTFVQAFLGILVPEVIALLKGGFMDISAFWKILAPFVAAALAAGISAVWNIMLEQWRQKQLSNVPAE